MSVLDWLQQSLGGTQADAAAAPAADPGPYNVGKYLNDLLSEAAGQIKPFAGSPQQGPDDGIYDPGRSFAENQRAFAAAALDPQGLQQAMNVALSVGPGAMRSGGLPAPSIGRGSEAPLFDYSRLSERPDVPQLDLERYVPPRGVSARAQALADPANMARMAEYVKQGAQQGGLGWYNTEPLRGAFQEVLGEGPGQQAYSRYMDMVAATSPKSKTPANARNASYYYTLAQQGLPIPDAPLPQPYGSIAQQLHIQNARNVLESGGIPVIQNPKPASFSQNLQGNWQPVTGDTHNMRLLGLGADKPNPNEYGFLERLQQGEAAKLGMSPAQYQASAWIGGGKQTGLGSPTDPFLKVLEDRVRLTAAKRGITPQQALTEFIKGNAPLLSAGGVGVGLGGLGGLGGVPDEATPVAVR